MLLKRHWMSSLRRPVYPATVTQLQLYWQLDDDDDDDDNDDYESCDRGTEGDGHDVSDGRWHIAGDVGKGGQVNVRHLFHLLKEKINLISKLFIATQVSILLLG